MNRRIVACSIDSAGNDAIAAQRQVCKAVFPIIVGKRPNATVGVRIEVVIFGCNPGEGSRIGRG